MHDFGVIGIGGLCLGKKSANITHHHGRIGSDVCEHFYD